MSFAKLAEFADFLARKDRTLKEILNHLSRSVLEVLEVDSIMFFQADESNQFSLTESSGVGAQAALEFATYYDLDDNWPAADSIRHGRIIWINSFNVTRLDYPKIEEAHPLLVGNKSLILFPIFLMDTPIAAIAVTSRTHLEEQESINAFLTAVASVFSMYYYMNLNSSKISVAHALAREKLLPSIGVEGSLSLTDRQLVILRLISEDRTNKSISEFLGYSESTVRQDIMKIFVQLGCTHRSEAGAMYKDYSSKHLI